MGTRLNAGTRLGRGMVVAVCLVLLSGTAAPKGQESAAEDDGAAAAREVVEALHATLLACMQQADALGFQGRYDRIVTTLDRTFDLPLMARLSVGGTWKQLSSEEREEFVALSRRYSASSYAHNFSGFGGERFETLADEPAARGTLVVKTRFVQPEDDDVLFDYRLRRTPEGWRIIDVQLDGRVSEITLRRADYRGVIERKGFPQLVEDLEQKIEELSEEG